MAADAHKQLEVMANGQTVDQDVVDLNSFMFGNAAPASTSGKFLHLLLNVVGWLMAFSTVQCGQRPSGPYYKASWYYRANERSDSWSA